MIELFRATGSLVRHARRLAPHSQIFFLEVAPTELGSILDASETSGLCHRWAECPDGPAATLSMGEMLARGLAPGEDGRWIKEDSKSYRGRRHSSAPVRESELFAGAGEGGWGSTAGVHSGSSGGLDILPGRGPSPLDLMIAAEEIADSPPAEDEPDRSKGGRPAELSFLKGMAGRGVPVSPLTLERFPFDSGC